MQSCCACGLVSALQAFLADSSAWAASLFDIVAAPCADVLVSVAALVLLEVCAWATANALDSARADRVEKTDSFMVSVFLVSPRMGPTQPARPVPDSCLDVSNATLARIHPQGSATASWQATQSLLPSVSRKYAP